MTSPNACPVCHKEVPGNPEQFQRHVNEHLDEGEEEESRKVAEQLHEENLPNGPYPVISTDGTGQVENGELGPAEQMMRQLELNDEAYARSLATPGAYAVAPLGSMEPSLRGSLSDTAEHFYPSILSKIFLHYEGLDIMPKKKAHICSKMDLFCSNVAGLGWDCGFRNIQMIFSALFYQLDYCQQLREAGLTEVPSVPEIAGRIEEAWKKGFDPEGAATFDGKLMDKEVWIGATEVYVLLRSLNLQAYVKDFEAPTEAEKHTMFDWVFDHFEQWCCNRQCMVHCKNILSSRRQGLVPPIFCQWQGHSITIVGAEKTKAGEIVLLILDPSRGFYHSLMQQRASGLHLVRRTVRHSQFSHPRFQFVSIPAPRSSGMSSIRLTKRRMLDRLKGGPS